MTGTCAECKAPDGTCWSQSGSMGGKYACSRDWWRNCDKATIELLLEQAKKNCKQQERYFRKYDSADAMHSMEGWQQTITWLENYI